MRIRSSRLIKYHITGVTKQHPSYKTLTFRALIQYICHLKITFYFKKERRGGREGLSINCCVRLITFKDKKVRLKELGNSSLMEIFLCVLSYQNH